MVARGIAPHEMRNPREHLDVTNIKVVWVPFRVTPRRVKDFLTIENHTSDYNVFELGLCCGLGVRRVTPNPAIIPLALVCPEPPPTHNNSRGHCMAVTDTRRSDTTKPRNALPRLPFEL